MSTLPVTQENLSRGRQRGRVKAEQELCKRAVRMGRGGGDCAMSQPWLKKESEQLPPGTGGVK